MPPNNDVENDAEKMTPKKSAKNDGEKMPLNIAAE